MLLGVQHGQRTAVCLGLAVTPTPVPHRPHGRRHAHPQQPGGASPHLLHAATRVCAAMPCHACTLTRTRSSQARPATHLLAPLPTPAPSDHILSPHAHAFPSLLWEEPPSAAPGQARPGRTCAPATPPFAARLRPGRWVVSGFHHQAAHHQPLLPGYYCGAPMPSGAGAGAGAGGGVAVPLLPAWPDPEPPAASSSSPARTGQQRQPQGGQP